MNASEIDIIKDFKQQLYDSRETVIRLRKRLVTLEAAYRERIDDIKDLRKALDLIATNGGKTIDNSEHDGLPLTICDGDWCANEAYIALDHYFAKPVNAFTLV